MGEDCGAERSLGHAIGLPPGIVAVPAVDGRKLRGEFRFPPGGHGRGVGLGNAGAHPASL
jgi:hypothetical protein